MANYSICDSYFVEEEPAYLPRSREDFIKFMGRRKQEAMADELSRQACETYMEDIVQHMRLMEEETMPDVASIDIQQEIQWFMRPYLIDFLIEAHAAFQLLPETLFLAVNLLDRYCSRRVVYKRHYQLVGCAALLIAAKYGDKKDRTPLIRELKSMCCSLYDEEMFTQMEWHVLNTLDWVIGHPTVDSWLQLALLDGPREDVELEHMAWYICEIALYHRDFVSTKPSVMARASLALARGILGRPEVFDGYEHLENLTLLHLSQKLHRPSPALSRKYASPQFSHASAKLDFFLMQQEMMNKQPTPPPTTHLTPASAQKPGSNVYDTPQQRGYGNMVNGYLTPPVTPDGEYFVAGNGTKYDAGGHRYPTTPTPGQPNSRGAQRYTLQPTQRHHPY